MPTTLPPFPPDTQPEGHVLSGWADPPGQKPTYSPPNVYLEYLYHCQSHMSLDQQRVCKLKFTRWRRSFLPVICYVQSLISNVDLNVIKLGIIEIYLRVAGPLLFPLSYYPLPLLKRGSKASTPHNPMSVSSSTYIKQVVIKANRLGSSIIIPNNEDNNKK